MTDYVIASKKELLLPKMVFFQTGEVDGKPTGFFLKELDGTALLEFKTLAESMEGKLGDRTLTPEGIELIAKFVLLAACDGDGNPYFTEEDVPLLTKKPVFLLDVANMGMPLSGVVLVDTEVGEVAVDLKNDQPSSSTTD